MRSTDQPQRGSRVSRMVSAAAFGLLALLASFSLVVGASSTASAAEAPAGSTVASAASAQAEAQIAQNPTVQDLHYTFTNGQTKAIYAAASNADHLTTLCKNIIHGSANVLCEGFKFVALPILNLGKPGNHDCLYAFARVGLPPVGVHYVHC